MKMRTHSQTLEIKHTPPTVVAQSCTLLYRRIAFCIPTDNFIAPRTANAPPTASRRYSRLKICATADTNQTNLLHPFYKTHRQTKHNEPSDMKPRQQVNKRKQNQAAETVRAHYRSAELHSAVSQNCILRPVRRFHSLTNSERSADRKSIQQIENLRYFAGASPRHVLLHFQSSRVGHSRAFTGLSKT